MLLQLAPILWLSIFFLFVARGWLEIGHIPSYANPDPKQLDMDLHHGLLWIFLYVLPWLIFGYGLISIGRKLSVWKVVILLALISTTLLIVFGPHALFWPAIWAIPFTSSGTVIAMMKGPASKTVKWQYALGLVILNILLFADPLRLMEWFYD